MLKDQHVNTGANVKDDGIKRMPHERDEAPDNNGAKTRSVMRQAAADIDSGMVDTDLHNQRGVQKPRAGAEAQPQPNVKRD
ncbi:MAG TPA: hypothetical protein VFX55_15750 [Duganella sp.]|nr:hypothetical protein [Duganella sp.]